MTFCYVFGVDAKRKLLSIAFSMKEKFTKAAAYIKQADAKTLAGVAFATVFIAVVPGSILVPAIIAGLRQTKTGKKIEQRVRQWRKP